MDALASLFTALERLQIFFQHRLRGLLAFAGSSPTSPQAYLGLLFVSLAISDPTSAASASLYTAASDLPQTLHSSPC